MAGLGKLCRGGADPGEGRLGAEITSAMFLHLRNAALAACGSLGSKRPCGGAAGLAPGKQRRPSLAAEAV